MKVVRGPDGVSFKIVECTVRQSHVPTQAELAAEAKWKKDLERSWGRLPTWELPSSRRAYPELNIIYTGEFSLHIEGWGNGIRCKWADDKTQILEPCSTIRKMSRHREAGGSDCRAGTISKPRHSAEAILRGRLSGPRRAAASLSKSSPSKTDQSISFGSFMCASHLHSVAGIERRPYFSCSSPSS